ncbi:MAG: 50S ribosomal protein L4 [Parcubacteria group bacterium]
MKLTAPVFSMAGKKISTVELDSKVFGVSVTPELLRRAVVTQRANSRQVLAHTKTRAERRGGGRKPWKQKGTGRARHGSIRSPLWRKGGVTFGPRSNRNFSIKINRKERRKALLGALSLTASRNQVVVLEGLSLEKIKTKPLAQLFSKLPIKRSALLVLSEHNDKVERSARNLATIKTQIATNLNLEDVLGHEHLVFTKTALERVAKTYRGI